MWAESQTPNEFKSKSEKIGKAKNYWKCESLKMMHVRLSFEEYLQCLCNNFHTGDKRRERK